MQAFLNRSKLQLAKTSVPQRLRSTVALRALPSAETPAAANPAVSLAERQQQQQEHRRYVLEESKNFLAADLQRLFDTGNITTSRYAKNITFEDPISKYSDLDGYLFMIRALRTLFDIKYELHTLEVAGPEDLEARWTMTMRAWLLPWKPKLIFTGKSFYQVNPDSGVILGHKDVWDAVSNNQFPSIEAVVHVIRQSLDIQLTPELESPEYNVLKRTQEYELRQYEAYLVAEVPMAPGSGPAGGSGFTELAGYIFGGNSQGLKMEMTTPVFTRTGDAATTSTSSSSSGGSGTYSNYGKASSSSSSSVRYSDPNTSRMQFMLEKRFADVSILPDPLDARINRKEERGRWVAAVQFSGWPLDFEVVAAEKQLRAALLRDGLQPAVGYTLARYNEPTVPPFLRRNEVLIDLENYSWP